MKRPLPGLGLALGMLLVWACLTWSGMREAGADLIGIKPLGSLLVKSQGSSAADATYTYDAGAGRGVLLIQAVPQEITLVDGTSAAILQGTLTIRITLDGSGNVVGGDPDGPDLRITGEVPSLLPGVPPGDLLTGEIVVEPSGIGFGFVDGFGTRPPTSLDRFDFRFTFTLPTSGALTVGPLAPHFAGQDIGVTLALENSDFADSFTVNFTGNPRVNAGPVPPFCINLRKQIQDPASGDPFADADHGDDADVPGTFNSQETALYRLLIKNCGRVTLHDVNVRDPDCKPLPDICFPVGDLEVGQTRTLTEADIPQLRVDSPCPEVEDNMGISPEQRGWFTDLAEVTGSTQTAQANQPPQNNRRVTDSDVAVAQCLNPPSMDFNKLIKDRNGQFVNADRLGVSEIPAVQFPSEAEYRLMISKPPAQSFSRSANPRIRDPLLGINEPLGNFELRFPNNSRILKETQPLQRCDHVGVFTNVASFAARVTNPEGVGFEASSIQAILLCVGNPQIEFKKEIRVLRNGASDFVDANNPGDPDVPMVEPTDSVEFRLTVRNIGTLDLAEIFIDDPDLGRIMVSNLASPLSGQAEAVITRTVNNPCTTLANPSNPGNAQVTGGVEGALNEKVSDQDRAVLNCVTPGITLDKRVSLDNGATYIDAQPGDPTRPTVEIGQTILYKITVTNTATVGLEVEVTDSMLPGVNPFQVGRLNPGETRELPPQSFEVKFCPDNRRIPNTATAVGHSVLTTEQVIDQDTVQLECVPTGPGPGEDEPRIQLIKRAIVRGRTFNANPGGDIPAVELENETVQYQIEISNTGQVALRNVTVEDPTLGLTRQIEGELGVGAPPLVLNASDDPRLNRNLCQQAGQQAMNTATAQGRSAQTDNPAEPSSDQAVLNCVESKLALSKQVSVDGGATFLEADSETDPGGVPRGPFPNGALFRLIITNTGTTDLRNVTLSDPLLEIQGFAVGDLAAGGGKTLTTTELPALQVNRRGLEERCAQAPIIDNGATVSGESVQTGRSVSANNRAVLLCSTVPPPIPIPLLGVVPLLLSTALLGLIALFHIRAGRRGGF